MRGTLQFVRFIHSATPLRKVVPKNLKGKSTSSQEWITRQLNDPYVKKAQEMGYRARSAFKLLEIEEKIKILKPGMTIVECGAAPGAWTQVIVSKVNSTGQNSSKPIGQVVGIDLLPVTPLTGASFLFGDFTNPQIQAQVLSLLQGESEGCGGKPNIDAVLSDMAPNATGILGTDHPRIITLAKKALQFALTNAKVGSHFLTKIWDGSETASFIKELETFYQKVTRFKPSSSRSESSEFFIFAKSKKAT